MQLRNGKGKTILSCIVDMYGKFPETNLRFLSPVLPKNSYTLTMTVLGAHSSWSDKRKSDYGSTGNVVAFSRFVIKE